MQLGCFHNASYGGNEYNSSMVCWTKRFSMEETIKMVRAAQRNGADVRLTIDPDVHHEAWEKAYASDAMWEWLLAQKKNG